MTLIETFLKRCKETEKVIGVMGDCFVDEWVPGAIERINPEAPCPVFRQTGPLVQRQGGATNVANQFHHFNVCVRHDIFRPVDVGLKRRFCVNGQTVFRYDVEVCGRREPKYEALKMCGAIILSDYDKGYFDRELIDQVIRYAINNKILTVGDHKRRPLVEWRGIDILKMNAKEATQHFFDNVGAAVVITNGSHPPNIFTHDQNGLQETIFENKPLSVPIRSVCGAGDCFTAFLTLAKLHDFSLAESAQIAHLAGGAYVQHPFNTPILPYELLKMESPSLAKQITLEEWLFIHKHRKEDLGKIVVANGVFDLLHAGHIQTLEWAKQQGDTLIVALNTDSSVQMTKGKARPIMSFEERQTALVGLQCVDFVIPFVEPDPEYLLSIIRPGVLVKGFDVVGLIPGCQYARDLLLAPEFPFNKLHTSSIIERVRKASGSLL